jgi:hypothetical protein
MRAFPNLICRLLTVTCRADDVVEKKKLRKTEDKRAD